MSPREKCDLLAAKRLAKIKSLLKKYRHVKNMQSSLLELSELASKITDMQAFYPALESVIKSLFVADSFFIVLTNQQQKLSLAYNHNPQERRLLACLEHQNWLESLTGIVYTQKKPLHCNAQQRKQLALAGEIVLYGSNCVDWIGVPLKRGNQTIGVLTLQSYSKKHYFDDRDVELLQFIAQYIVIAIDRVKSRELLEQSIQERTKKLQEANKKLSQEIVERKKAEKVHKSLLAISEITASSADLNTFYQALYQELNQLINAQNCYIALLTQQGQRFEFPFYIDESITPIKHRAKTKGLTELVIEIAKPILISQGKVAILQDDGAITLQSFDSSYLRDNTPKPKAYLAVPLIITGEIVGVLAVQHHSDEKAYQKADLELMRFISYHIATAINRKSEQDRKQRNKEELERLVDERTKALQASNRNLRMQIEERRKAEDRLYYEAHHDALTKLPNRALLSDRLSHALRHIKRYPNQRAAVLFIDLDRFKMINDTLGHHAGDQFLIEISARLKKCIRENDVLARLGGDEFVILLDSIHQQDDIEEIVSRITLEVEQPFNLNGNTVYSSASIGIANCSPHYKNASEVLRDADAAMYQAKSLGRGRYVFFDSSMREQLLANLALEQSLRSALQQSQFELHYQRILDLTNTKTIGFEALLRWNHPEKGLLHPKDFLAVAEETGILLDIENWVLRQVCAQFTTWQFDQEYANAFISINLSERHLSQANLLNKLIEQISQYTNFPEKLILEFDEAAFSKHPEQALKSLKKLKEAGVRLALDDYGAGMSSMTFLCDYPFEFIKLDRAFIQSLHASERNISIIKALSSLGEQFGYRLVAEGIESQDVLAKVQAAGCEFGQGYFINRPEKIMTEAEKSDDNCNDFSSCA